LDRPQRFFEPREWQQILVYIALDTPRTLAGVAGYLDATLYGFVNPAQLGWRRSGLILVTVLLGGKGTLYGPALGALLLAFIEHYGERVTEHWNALIAALVIAVVLFLPRGLAGLVQGGRRA